MRKRPLEALVKRVDQVEVSSTVRGRGRSRNTIGDTIKKKTLDSNDL